MSTCDSCARIITCPRPETRAVLLSLIEHDDKIMSEFISERLSPEEVAPASIFVEFVLFGSVSPYQVSRRLSAVVFRLAETPDMFEAFMENLDTTLKTFPPQFLSLVAATLSESFKLYEWRFYKPHVERFGRLARAAGLSHLSSGLDHLDSMITARVPCSYINLTTAIEALKNNPPKTVAEAKASLEASAAISQAQRKVMPHEEFLNVPPVGGIN